MESGRKNFKSGQSPEVEGKSPLIDGIKIAAVPRKDRIEPKLVMAVGITADEFNLIDNGRSLREPLGLQCADKDHSPIGQHALQGNVLTGKVVPGEIRLLDKKSLVFIPAGDFDAVGIRWR